MRARSVNLATPSGPTGATTLPMREPTPVDKLAVTLVTPVVDDFRLKDPGIFIGGKRVSGGSMSHECHVRKKKKE